MFPIQGSQGLNLFTFRVITANFILLFVFYMPYTFLSLTSHTSSFVFSWFFFIVKHINFLLISFCVYSLTIFFVVTMRITFDNLNCSILIWIYTSLNSITYKHSSSGTAPSPFLSVTGVTKLHLYTLCVQNQ